MKARHFVLSTVACGIAATLLLPTSSVAFATAGFSLPLNQRDFRVFNNFTDVSANDNQTPDPNFPGYQGAVMAIWKGCIEWQSQLHGDGNGDPTQPGDLGSGGANFDATFQGEATGVGGLKDNIFSELAGSNGGVLAFTEMPDATGWRIRFYSTWTWSDGPGIPPVSEWDIQGVACAAYGYALGLSQSNVAGATMLSPPTGTGSSLRSLAADDIAGIQAVYGAAAATKPRITGVSVRVNSLTITGTNFDATDNTVWFTQLASGGSGAPVQSASVPSSAGGTSITVSVPLGAGPGDVLVKVPGFAHSALSNAWPFEVMACPPPTTFCLSAPNSVGAGSLITYSGSLSVTVNDLHLITTGNPPNAFGRYFYGMNMVAPIAFGNGWRCIDPLVRLPTMVADSFGDADFALDLGSLVPPNTISAGETWGFQFWYRNPAAGGANFNASDALAVEFCP